MTDVVDLGPLHDRALNAVGAPHTCTDRLCACRVPAALKNPAEYVPEPSEDA